MREIQYMMEARRNTSPDTVKTREPLQYSTCSIADDVFVSVLISVEMLTISSSSYSISWLRPSDKLHSPIDMLISSP
jgi:hypothetical protein